MTSRTLALPATILALATLVGSSPSIPAAPPADDGIAVQARGPVHEGYAQPFDPAPRPGPVVPKAPPDPVPEMPPEQKPEGDSVQWVPGYWGWDADRNDYTWVSGFWRAAPPGRQWVGGTWRRADDGWQWLPGYWAPAGRQQQPPLLDPPPAPLEAGPSVPAPDDDSLYVPGSWVWRTARYYWRPGFWRAARPGWVWAPAHYVWTPGGCVFVDGYWDYPLEDRGLLFAPVVFERPLWRTPGWCYRPSFVVGIGTPFFSALFVRPSCGHYYFGDYYDPACARAGYHPWALYGARHYDPLFGYYRWSHRDDPRWERGLRDVYAARRDGELARPPRTLVESGRVARGAAPVVQPLGEFRGGPRLSAISRTEVLDHQAAARRTQEAARQRVRVEAPDAPRRPAVNPPPRHAQLTSPPPPHEARSRTPTSLPAESHPPARAWPGGPPGQAQLPSSPPPREARSRAPASLPPESHPPARAWPGGPPADRPPPRADVRPSRPALVIGHAPPAPRADHRGQAPAPPPAPAHAGPPPAPPRHAPPPAHSGGGHGGGHQKK